MRKLKTIEMNRLTVEEFKEAPKLPLIVVLDDVRSLYNVGSVFRSCDAFRVEAVYLCGITATPPHPEIHKTALGGEDSVSWKYFPTALVAVEDLKRNGYFVYAIEQVEGSTKLHELKLKGDGEGVDGSFEAAEGEGVDGNNQPTEKAETEGGHRPTKHAVVFGNEVKGVHQEVVDACDGCLEIPQFGTKHSLNVSVTAGIVVWEFARQVILKK